MQKRLQNLWDDVEDMEEMKDVNQDYQLNLALLVEVSAPQVRIVDHRPAKNWTTNRRLRSSALGARQLPWRRSVTTRTILGCSQLVLQSEKKNRQDGWLFLGASGFESHAIYPLVV